MTLSNWARSFRYIPFSILNVFQMLTKGRSLKGRLFRNAKSYLKTKGFIIVVCDPNKECNCNPLQIQCYLAEVSVPLLNQIDSHIEVSAVRYSDLASKESGEKSEAIRERVQRAREVQLGRFQNSKHLNCNADMQSKDIRSHCQVDQSGQELLKTAINQLGLSARAYDRILKVARTIADLSGTAYIRPEFISEAIQYRSLDRQLWV